MWTNRAEHEFKRALIGDFSYASPHPVLNIIPDQWDILVFRPCYWCGSSHVPKAHHNEGRCQPLAVSAKARANARARLRGPAEWFGQVNGLGVGRAEQNLTTLVGHAESFKKFGKVAVRNTFYVEVVHEPHFRMWCIRCAQGQQKCAMLSGIVSAAEIDWVKVECTYPYLQCSGKHFVVRMQA